MTHAICQGAEAFPTCCGPVIPYEQMTATAGDETMRQFRVTKCDPAHRDHAGRYRHDTWTSHGNVTRTFEGGRLSQAGFVHMGHDFCMPVGVPELCEVAQAAARTLGLFVGPFASPHRETASPSLPCRLRKADRRK